MVTVDTFQKFLNMIKLLHFKEKGEILIKHETETHLIFVAIHTNESWFWKNTFHMSKKPCHILAHSYNKETEDGRWILGDAGYINFFRKTLIKDDYNKHLFFNTSKRLRLFDRGTVNSIDQTEEYISIKVSAKGINRHILYKLNERPSLLISDETADTVSYTCPHKKYLNITCGTLNDVTKSIKTELDHYSLYCIEPQANNIVVEIPMEP